MSGSLWLDTVSVYSVSPASHLTLATHGWWHHLLTDYKSLRVVFGNLHWKYMGRIKLFPFMEHLLRLPHLHTWSLASHHTNKKQWGQDFTRASQMSKSFAYSFLLPSPRRDSLLGEKTLHWEYRERNMWLSTCFPLFLECCSHCILMLYSLLSFRIQLNSHLLKESFYDLIPLSLFSFST